MQPALILVTNDDGVTSEGLWAVVEAMLPLGEIYVVAPDRQWSGAGRAMPHDVTGALDDVSRDVDGQRVVAYSVDASPALAVTHGVLELTPRRPDLVVSGVNFGANLSIEVTISGTVGAAMEAAAFGIPAIAVSQEMDPNYYLTGDRHTDYAAAQAIARQFAEHLLAHGMPQAVDLLNINVPADATPATPWRYTRLSHFRYFEPLPPDRTNGTGRPRYRLIREPERTEPSSDLWAVLMKREISVTPLSLDLTSREGFHALSQDLTAPQAVTNPLFRLPDPVRTFS